MKKLNWPQFNNLKHCVWELAERSNEEDEAMLMAVVHLMAAIQDEFDDTQKEEA